MPVIVVAAAEPGAGATTVAAGLAHRLAYLGRRVQVERLQGGPRATSDARAFGMLEVATSGGAPLAQTPAAPPSPTDVLILEAPSGEAAALASRLGGRLVVVARAGAAEGPALPPGGVLLINHSRRAGPHELREDRLLAAPTVGTLIEASRARVLARSAGGDLDVCEHIVIGPVSSDPNDTHFARFPRKAVVTRAEKVDIALAALRTETRCLILSGGSDPSPYLIDRVSADRRTTLLLTEEGTVETVRDIEATFGASAFAGDEKLERASTMLGEALTAEDLAALAG